MCKDIFLRLMTLFMGLVSVRRPTPPETVRRQQLLRGDLPGATP